MYQWPYSRRGTPYCQAFVGRCRREAIMSWVTGKLKCHSGIELSDDLLVMV